MSHYIELLFDSNVGKISAKIELFSKAVFLKLFFLELKQFQTHICTIGIYFINKSKMQ